MYFQLDMSSLELEIISVAAQQVGIEIEIIEVGAIMTKSIG